MYTNSPVASTNRNKNAQIMSSKLNNSLTRKRAYVDFSGANFALSSLVNLGIRTSQDRSLFKSARLYLDFEIVDIYCNSHMLYVLTSYGVSNVRVPLLHKKYNMLPEAYLVVDLKIGMKSAEIKGVIYPSDLSEDRIDGKGYKFDINDLHPLSELIPKIKRYAGVKPSVGRHLDCMGLFIPYIDGKLSEENKIKLIGHILSCETCKKRLIEAVEFDTRAKKIKSQQNVLQPKDTVNQEAFLKRIKNQHILKENNPVKGAIDVIYKNEKVVEVLEDDAFKAIPEIPKKIKYLVLGTCGIILLFGIILALAVGAPRAKDSDMESYQDNPPSEEQYVNNSGYEIVVPQMKKNKGYTTVSKVSWEVTFAAGDEQKKFLQSAGKSIKLNLQNDLLLSSEAVINNRVKFDIKFQKNGAIEELNIEQSSGSGAVDEVIRQSIENTLHYMQAPKGSFTGKKSTLTLVIDF